MGKLNIDSEIKDAFRKLNNREGPYIHSATFEEFMSLRKKLEALGFRVAGNVDIIYDPLYRKVYKNAEYDVIRTQGFDTKGIPIQDYEFLGDDCVFFFIREREKRETT